MQLKRLYIKDYKLFKDLTYEFPADSQHYIHVLIGINGSGKSTILEAIAKIFSCVSLGEKAEFDFEIEYFFEYNFIDPQYEYPLKFFIRGKKDEKPELFIKPANETEFLTVPRIDNYRKFAPSSIVIYYSGYSTPP